MEKILARLESDIDKLYKQGGVKIAKMYKDYFKQFEAEDAEMRKKAEVKNITQREYKDWRMRTMTTGKKWNTFCAQVSNELLELNKQAVELSNRTMDKAFIKAYNEAGKDIAKRAEKL